MRERINCEREINTTSGRADELEDDTRREKAGKGTRRMDSNSSS